MKLRHDIDPSKKIKNIIFDLGGVILNINYQHTIERFKALGFENIDETFSMLKQSSLFDGWDTGKITPDEFRTELKSLISSPVNDEQINEAWCAMLLDIPPKRIELLQELKSHYNTYLFSNTNAIHLLKFDEMMREQFNIEGLSPLFKKDYYSNIIGYRKPDAESYLYILEEQDLKPEETMFIDDLEPNIHGANSVGIKGYHLVAPETILNLFTNGTH